MNVHAAGRGLRLIIAKIVPQGNLTDLGMQHRETNR
jgi:hypothetical protein